MAQRAHSRLAVVVVIGLGLVAVGTFTVIRQRHREDKLNAAGQGTTSTTGPADTTVPLVPAAPSVPDTTAATLSPETTTAPTLATTPTTVALGQPASPDAALPHTGRDAPFGAAVLVAVAALGLATLRRSTGARRTT